MGSGLIQKTHVKLLTGATKHLAIAAGPDSGGATLCGCSITRTAMWKIINSLEGDECPRCAERAFLPAEPSVSNEL